MWPWLKSSPDDKVTQDLRLAKAVSMLMQHLEIKFTEPNNLTWKFSGLKDAPVWEIIREFEAMHKTDPRNPVLRYAHAAALASGAGHFATAEDILLETTHECPEFWLADVTLRNWDPGNFFLLPAFSLTDTAVDRRIDVRVKTAVVLSTRCGALPRSAIFVRCDSVFGSIDLSTLKSSRIEFITVISKINDPQVVAIYFRLHDDPVRPLQYEMLAVPFNGSGRFAYEVFVRQQTFDFVVLDTAGHVVHTREVTPSKRMQAAHSTLAGMFGRAPTLEELDEPARLTHALVDTPSQGPQAASLVR